MVRNQIQNIPIPDPSLLTTEQLRRELAALKETIETRLEGMDKAVVLLKENVALVPAVTDKQIFHLKELHDEKFNSIQQQFKERDTRGENDKTAASTAVNAALQAQKEAAGAQNEANSAAITKSEGAYVKQIDGLQALLLSNNQALNDKISVINGRLDRGEGKVTGSSHQLSTSITIGALAIAALSLLFNFTNAKSHGEVQLTPPVTVTAPAPVR